MAYFAKIKAALAAAGFLAVSSGKVVTWLTKVKPITGPNLYPNTYLCAYIFTFRKFATSGFVPSD